MSSTPQKVGYFFRWIEPATGNHDRIGWYGPIDLARIKWFRTHLGDVPAPFWSERDSGATPREMIATQFTRKPRFIGPASLRHLRSMSDWLRPTTWPLLEAVHAGEIVDLYYSHFNIVPSQRIPDSELVRKFEVRRDWNFWCNAADQLGFLGVETNEGFEPYLVVFSADASQRILSDPSFAADGPPPAWYLDSA